VNGNFTAAAELRARNPTPQAAIPEDHTAVYTTPPGSAEKNFAALQIVT
jgi:hypothetical protein